MTKNDALLPCPFCGEQPQVNQFGGVVHDLDNEKAANCWLSCTSTENISEWQTRPTPAPLAKGETRGLMMQVEDREKVLQWVAIQKALYGMVNRRAVAKSDERGETATELAVSVLGIIEKALTPSPVSVDAKAGETTDKDCYVHQPLGKDPEFDAWEKLHDPQQYESRLLRTKLSSERAQHRAWRKRAEEAEAAQSSHGEVQEVTVGEFSDSMAEWNDESDSKYPLITDWLMAKYPNGLRIVKDKA